MHKVCLSWLTMVNSCTQSLNYYGIRFGCVFNNSTLCCCSHGFLHMQVMILYRPISIRRGSICSYYCILPLFPSHYDILLCYVPLPKGSQKSGIVQFAVLVLMKINAYNTVMYQPYRLVEFRGL